MGFSRPTPAIEADWDAIYRDHEWRVRRFLWRKVPASLLDDVVQETFLRAYGSRHRFDPTRPPGPWLLTIARRARADALEVLPPAASCDVDGSVAVDDDADPHIGFERRLRRQAMATALANLSPRHRRLLIEWELKGDLDFGTLAREEGITPQALKSVLGRARQAFRTSYATAAERTGAAAAVVWSRVLRRSRGPRTIGWSPAGIPLMEAAMGGMAALVTATVLLHAGTATNGAVSISAVDARNLGANGVLDVPSTAAPSVSRPATATGSPRTDDLHPSPKGATPPVDAKAEVRITVGTAKSDTDIVLGIDYPTGTKTADAGVEFRCDTALRAAACGIARQTPLAR